MYIFTLETKLIQYIYIYIKPSKYLKLLMVALYFENDNRLYYESLYI
jgi:hypothetical protein